MSERNDKTLQAPHEGAQQAPTTESRTGFGRAENRLAAGNEDSDERAGEALARIENRPTRDRAPKINAADSLTQSGERDEGDEAEREANEEIDAALDEKAREAGGDAAEDSAHIEWSMTPHNL